MNSLKRLFSPPVFDDEEKTRLAGLLNTIILAVGAVTLLATVALIPSPTPLQGLGTISMLFLVEVFSYVLLKRGAIRGSGILLATFLWLVLAVAATFSNGIHDPTYSTLVVIVVMAGMILGSLAGIVFSVLSILFGLILVYAETNGFLPTPLTQITPTGIWVSISIGFAITAALVYITSQSLKDALKRARENESAQIQSNRELQKMRTSLEDTVAARTFDLAERTRYLEASNKVGQAITSILDDELIKQVCEIIREQFGLYYVGLFLLDGRGEWAVLQAGTGSAGHAMLDRGHRIRVGTGMIGWSIANRQARVAQQTGEDAVRLATPELPDTRSEAAIPLRSRGEILGALTVQSKRPGVFGEVTISAFQAMADQVAVAIDNARLYTEAQQALEAAHRAYGDISQKAWVELLSQTQQGLGFRYQSGSVAPSQLAWSEELAETIRTGEINTATKNGVPYVFVPVKVRQQVIGVMKLNKEMREGAWSHDEIAMLASISEQLGVALESARLYTTTQRRAFQEELIGKITDRMRETLNIDTVLQTAAVEMRRVLDLSEVEVLLSNSSSNPPAGKNGASSQLQQEPENG